MGDRLTAEPETAGEVFDRIFPEYLVMGMTPEQFWDGESWLKKSFREAYKIRMRNDERIRDQTAWLNGVYIRDALQSIAILVNGFVPTGAEVMEYPQMPRLEKAEAEKQEATRKTMEEQQAQLAMAMFQVFTANVNKSIEKREQKGKEQGIAT